MNHRLIGVCLLTCTHRTLAELPLGIDTNFRLGGSRCMSAEAGSSPLLPRGPGSRLAGVGRDKVPMTSQLQCQIHVILHELVGILTLLSGTSYDLGL